jgi:hypothetical protein
MASFGAYKGSVGVLRRAVPALACAAGVVVAAAGATAQTAGPSIPPQAQTEPTAAPSIPPQAQTLSALMEGMRSATGVVAEFEETKQLALLSAPLTAKGTVYFVPPDRLVREVTDPGRSRLVVNGDKVSFEDETGRNARDLSASPMARQMIDSFVVLFNGDEKRLRELYEVTFTADGEGWRLHLVPRSMPLNRMVASFEMTGRQARIDRMDMAEPDGDRTVTVFGKTDSAKQFTAEELATLFEEAPAS